MVINSKCKLIIPRVYYYDLEKCFYNVLTKIGYDISNIPIEKLQRNIYIGMLQKNDPNLIAILRTTTINIIDEILLRNKLNEDDIITRQFDGFLSSTKIQYIPKDISENKYKYIIISSDRKKYMLLNNKVIVKGISQRYSSIDSFYNMFNYIDFSSKKSIFLKLSNIKDCFFKEVNKKIFCIPSKKDNKSVFMYLKKYGLLSIKKATITLLTINDIDKEKYWDHYFSPFIESIMIEYL